MIFSEKTIWWIQEYYRYILIVAVAAAAVVTVEVALAVTVAVTVANGKRQGHVSDGDGQAYHDGDAN